MVGKTIARVAALAAVILAASACGPAEEQTLTLRVGDQVNVMRTALTLAGEDQPSGYTIQWANFVGGPAVIAAETGGSLDIGWMAETPMVFAQAAGSPVRVVAVGRRVKPGTSNLGLIVAPDSPIRTVADLKGRKVAFMPGTVTQYFLVRLLEKHGLSLADIQAVTLANPSGALLKTGEIDATISGDPFLSKLVDAGEARIVATGGEPVTAELTYLVAPEAALADPKRAAAIGDFVVRVSRALVWQQEHPAEATPALARLYGVSPKVAEQVLLRSPTRFAPIDAAVIARHQEEADTFLRLGLIRTRLDAAKIFDDRYNQAIGQAASE